MEGKIITISREFGSGGRTIGRRVAERLGIPCYDSEIVERITAGREFTPEYVMEFSEDTGKRSWFSNAFGDKDRQKNVYQEDLWKLQCQIIKDIAEEGPCVIVGRCADYILKDYQNCIKVFIHSDMENRAKRIVEQYGDKSESPQKRLKDKDEKRIAYYEHFTNVKWGVASQYDISLNSGVLGIDKCVDIIVNL